MKREVKRRNIWQNYKNLGKQILIIHWIKMKLGIFLRVIM